MPIFVGTGTRQQRTSLSDAPRRPLPDYHQAKGRLGYDKLGFRCLLYIGTFCPLLTTPGAKKIFGSGLIYKRGISESDLKNAYSHIVEQICIIYTPYSHKTGAICPQISTVWKRIRWKSWRLFGAFLWQWEHISIHKSIYKKYRDGGFVVCTPVWNVKGNKTQYLVSFFVP